ncbi:Cysteine--tRNA ligase [uncultured archaeon]|nr:Cysteine--tRNA ligase [uncultured archaeon]
MRIYNTISGKAEEFSPQDGNRVRMYVCGITPYDKSHLGHARTVVSFDFIRRYLLFRGYSVKYVQNVTDIDDKIIRRAHERKMAPLALSQKYAAESEREFEKLGVMKPDFSPKVSGSILEIIALVSRIEKNGFAYVTESGVYFDVLKFAPYGSLSHQSPDQIKSGARVEVDEKKKNPQDFCLWKLSGEPGVTFPSPWGRGRPGWHIECSAMATSALGDTLDIHGGARDLIFPHHENEIAQSEAATGKKFVRLWMHTGFLTVNGEKMAKSLHNFITIEEGLEKFSPQPIRMLFALSHYRSPIDFSESAIEAAGNSLATLHSAISAAESYTSSAAGDYVLRHSSPPAAAGGDGGLRKAAADAESEFMSRMDDDFDTPNAMAALFSLARKISGAASEGAVSPEAVKQAAAALQKLLAVLALAPMQENGTKVSEKEIQEAIARRNEARKKKDFAASDAIRNELSEKGVLLEDRKDGTTGWRRK